MEIFYILTIFILISSLLLILFAKIYNDFQEKILKIKDTEAEIDETLRKKYDIFINIFNLLKSNLKSKDQKNIKELEDIESLKDQNITSFDFYRKLIEYEASIIKLGNDIKKAQKVEDFSNMLISVEDINIKLNAQIKYYNEVISSYSVLYSKFPSKLIAKIARFENKTFFDNRNLDDKIKNDFQI